MIGILSILAELPGQQRRLYAANVQLEADRAQRAPEAHAYQSRRKAAKQGRG